MSMTAVTVGDREIVAVGVIPCRRVPADQIAQLGVLSRSQVLVVGVGVALAAVQRAGQHLDAGDPTGGTLDFPSVPTTFA